ncbi:OLC1v1006871C1 [Oldenlandia corymbosa var. corymbosa]|nr:OLC1v1006871C1 [Oldenlandia corymbosa var. corymbosa]
MNGIYTNKNHNLESSFPGCLGRMVNLFDLSAGMSANRLLTDKPHRDRSPHSRRSHSDISRMGHFEDQLADKVMVSELDRTCSNRKGSGTPMKMLIAQEMSKEEDSRHNPPSVVAKLMGLDALPRQQPDLAKERSLSRGYSRSQSDTLFSYWQHDKGFWDLEMQHEVDQHSTHSHHNECKDIYEIMQQPKTSWTRDRPPIERCNEVSYDTKMALVRQKFIEAKRLSTDEKLRQTQQYQDAIDVLNSNKDLFVKFLQEPNSMYSQHYNGNAGPPPETKRITVLRPCKIVENGKLSAKSNEKQIKKAAQVSQVVQSDKIQPGVSPAVAGWKVDESAAQPTRIVVLKPSPGKPLDIKAVVSPTPLSPRVLHGEEFNMEEDDEARKSREVAREITRQMRENLSGHRRDETLLSSVFSNGYIGDESSFHKSENEYAAGNLSDSEVMSPTSRHSWDYVNKYGSPFSSSSFSRASYSPESSVCREAKKRLSERWAMMASNGNYQEQRPMRRSSSTLGEMLALSDTKNTIRSAEGGCDEDSRDSTAKLVDNLEKDEHTDDPMRNLVRSKSLPVSSTVFGVQPHLDVPNEGHQKTEILKGTAKERRAKSSLKGKVSSLFFLRSKRSNKEKPVATLSKDESLPAGMPSDSLGSTENGGTQALNDDALEECSSPSLRQVSSTSSADLSGTSVINSSEAGFSLSKHLLSGNRTENQDQPSPVSVLETPFEEDEHTATESSGNSKLDEHGGLPVKCKSNLIDKSPPIGTIARTLSWDDSCTDTATSYPSKPSLPPQTAEEEEREWYFFVQALLSVAGLEGEVQSDTFLARWHSSESPLDPSLRDKYVSWNDKDMVHEAKRRQKRSTRKLVFDCVNAALVDMAGYGPNTCQRAIPCSGPHKTLLLEGKSFVTVDQVWARMKEWFSGEERCVSDDCGDNNSLVVEMVVRKEVVGKGWVDHLRLEMDNLGKEIESKLLEELVQEAVIELTCRGVSGISAI